MVLPTPGAGKSTRSSGQPVRSSASVGGRGLGKSRPTLGGKGLAGGRRHRKIIKDTVRGITKGDIRRLARRGGVKRISGTIYEDVREALMSHLRLILKDCCVFLDHSNRKTVTVSDVIFALKRIGRPIYGFDVGTYNTKKTKHTSNPRR